MRINGLAGPTAGGLRLTAEQVYSNCPKYIQRRDLESVRPDGPARVATVHNTLVWPDYRGNAMMMTLGNLAQNPAAGLLFVDWSTGTTFAAQRHSAGRMGSAGATDPVQHRGRSPYRAGQPAELERARVLPVQPVRRGTICPAINPLRCANVSIRPSQ